ncbi:MAG: asparagine synthase (glutamine-hydrolyzing), partial [Helicobacter sp.]|nr:asparagine synthase (glutamine-hydrolyzing) [Helicobacter sp.]
MCSICGGTYPLEDIKRASEAMIHRGPDFSGDYEDLGIALAHNRLKILDLNTQSNQPFTSPFCPHLVLVFNGEIYNYLEIKEELKKQHIPFFTQSDTEVLLHSFAHLGERCLQKLNGDFAFVIYDKRDKSLFLARDRLGNKPLFYTLEKEKILFASELKAFLKLKNYPLNLEEVSKWLLFGNGDLNKSIYEGIYSFPAAHYGVFKAGKL